jgi:lysophospholipase L1-like esterase
LLAAAISVAAVVFSLVFAEAALRIYGDLQDGRAIDRSWAAVPPTDGGEASLGEIIRISPDPRIIYELHPHMSVDFRGARTTTNAAGFRDRDYSLVKAPRTVRIFGLGDSIMFGWGVPDGADFLSLIEDRLNREFPRVRWEVINSAVPGYNTAMEVQTLRAKGLAYGPDIVVIDFLVNDVNLPNFIVPRRDYRSLRHSFVWDVVRNGIEGLQQTAGLRLIDAPRQVDGNPDPDGVPAQYRDMVGWDAYRREMEGLAEMSRRGGFDVVVMAAYGGYHPRALEAIRPNFKYVVDTFDAQQAWLARNGIREKIGSALTLSASDAHPSRLGHRIIADVLYDFLVQSGLVAAYLGRTGSDGSAAPP